MIAREQVIRHLQRHQQFTQHGVFLGQAEVDQVASEHDGIRALLELIDLGNTTTQTFGGIDHAIRFLAVRLDMQIGYLTQNHACASSIDVAVAVAVAAGKHMMACSDTRKPMRSPACQALRLRVSTITGSAAPISIINRVRSPMKKVDMT